MIVSAHFASGTCVFRISGRAWQKGSNELSVQFHLNAPEVRAGDSRIAGCLSARSDVRE